MFSLAMKHVMWEETIAHNVLGSNTPSPWLSAGELRLPCDTGEASVDWCSVSGDKEDPLSGVGDTDPPPAVAAELGDLVQLLLGVDPKQLLHG